MKKKFLFIILFVLIFSGIILGSLYYYALSFVPQKLKIQVDFLTPKHSVVQLSKQINIEKTQLYKNINRYSELNGYKYNKFIVTDIFALVNDNLITIINDEIIYDLSSNYALIIMIKANILHDEKGADESLNEFQKIIFENRNTIEHYSSYIGLIINLQKKH